MTDEAAFAEADLDEPYVVEQIRALLAEDDESVEGDEVCAEEVNAEFGYRRGLSGAEIDAALEHGFTIEEIYAEYGLTPPD